MSGVKDMNEISTVDFFPWAWMLHFARAFLSFNVVNALTKRKYGMFKTFIIYIGVCMAYSYATLQLKDMSQKVEYTCLTLYFLIQFVLVIFLTENKLYLKLISVISAFLTMLLSSALYYSFITLTFGKEGTEAFLNKTTLLSLICLCLFMVAFSFFVVFIIKVIKNKLNNTLEHNIKYIYFYLFPLTHIFAIQIVYAFEQQLVTKANEYPQRLSSVSCIYFVVCFIIDFSIMFAIDFFEKRELENLKYKQLVANNELDYQKYLQLKTERERYRKIRHDISNILTTAAGFIEIEKSQKALEILQKANDDIHNSAYEIICKNETINTIYTIKHRQAEEKGERPEEAREAHHRQRAHAPHRREAVRGLREDGASQRRDDHPHGRRRGGLRHDHPRPCCAGKDPQPARGGVQYGGLRARRAHGRLPCLRSKDAGGGRGLCGAGRGGEAGPYQAHDHRRRA